MNGHDADTVTAELNVNGRRYLVDAVPGRSLLEVLRDDLKLTGTKDGCMEGECGACTVLVDGRPLDACLVSVHTLADRTVTTIEGLTAASTDSRPTLQQSIVDAGGVQCGYCIPGIVMAATALLDDDPTADESAIRSALAGNICRCTGYAQIIEGVVALTSSPGQPSPPADDVEQGRGRG